MASSFVVPPGGFTAFNMMTPASRASLGHRTRSKKAGRRRKKTSGRKRTSARKKRSGGGRKMKFGSPAWQKKYKVGKFRK